MIKAGSLVHMKYNNTILMEVLSVKGKSANIKYIQSESEPLEYKWYELNQLVKLPIDLKISEYRGEFGKTYEIVYPDGKKIECLSFWFLTVIKDIMSGKEPRESSLYTKI